MASRNQAIEKYNQGKFQTALNIAKNFKIGVTDEQRAQMALGYECIAHQDTYAQMGYDCPAEALKAIEVLKAVLGINEVPEVEEDASVTDVVIDEDVQEVPEVEEDQATEENIGEAMEWLLVTSRRKQTGKLFAKTVYVDGPDTGRVVKQARSEGYQFVCLISKEKLTRFLAGDDKGCRGVITNLTKKGVQGIRKCLGTLYSNAHETVMTITADVADFNVF